MSGYTDLTKLDNKRNCLRRIARHDELQFSKDSIVNVMEKFVKTVNIMDETILVPCRLMDRQVGDGTDIIPAPGKDSTSNQHSMQSHNRGGVMNSKNVHEFLHSSELFNLYNVLNALKIELLWTGKDDNVIETEDLYKVNTEEYETRLVENESKTDLSTAAAAATSPSNNTGTVKGHMRRPSTASVASITSASNLSDSESDISNENDSGLDSDGNKSDNAPSSSADSISSSENCSNTKISNMDKATELAKRCRRHLTGLYQCLEQMTEASNYLTARYQSDIGPV